MMKIMTTGTEAIPAVDVLPLIRSIRDQRVIIDSDLAGIYGVEESGNCITVHPWLVEQVTKGNTFPLLSNAKPPGAPVAIPE